MHWCHSPFLHMSVFTDVLLVIVLFDLFYLFNYLFQSFFSFIVCADQPCLWYFVQRTMHSQSCCVDVSWDCCLWRRLLQDHIAVLCYPFRESHMVLCLLSSALEMAVCTLALLPIKWHEWWLIIDFAANIIPLVIFTQHLCHNRWHSHSFVMVWFMFCLNFGFIGPP